MIWKKILCPTDFSEASYEALAKAVAIAQPGESEICVVHVEPASEVLTPFVNILPDAEDETTRRVVAVQNLCAVLAERVPPSIRTRPILKQGNAAEQIVAAAREEGADIIVLTTHGAGDSRPAALGAVAEAVLRTAVCPVLTLSATVCDEMGTETEPPATLLTGTYDSYGFTACESSPFRPRLHSPRSQHVLYLDGD